MSKRMIGIGALSLATAAMVAGAPAAAMAGSPSGSYGLSNTTASVAVAPGAGAAAAAIAPQSVSDYPSASSTIVGSVGFIDSEQVGYFWSAARGDSVSQTLTGPNKLKKAVLKLDVVSNNLNNGAHVDWTVSINGTDIGSFAVNEGQLGSITKKFLFPKKTGGTYTVKMRVTNEVAGGEGSMTFRYAGTGQHSITLKKK